MHRRVAVSVSVVPEMRLWHCSTWGGVVLSCIEAFRLQKLGASMGEVQFILEVVCLFHAHIGHPVGLFCTHIGHLYSRFVSNPRK